MQPFLKDTNISGVVFTRSLIRVHHITSSIIQRFDTTVVTSGSSQESKTLIISKPDNYNKNHKKVPMGEVRSAIKEIEQVLCHDCLDISFDRFKSNNIHITSKTTGVEWGYI